MYIILTADNNVYMNKTLKGLERSMKAKLDKNDFKSFGQHYVLSMTTKDVEFVQDAKRLSAIPIQNLYKKDKLSLMMLGIFIIQFIILVRG